MLFQFVVLLKMSSLMKLTGDANQNNNRLQLAILDNIYIRVNASNAKNTALYVGMRYHALLARKCLFGIVIKKSALAVVAIMDSWL